MERAQPHRGPVTHDTHAGRPSSWAAWSFARGHKNSRWKKPGGDLCSSPHVTTPPPLPCETQAHLLRPGGQHPILVSHLFLCAPQSSLLSVPNSRVSTCPGGEQGMTTVGQEGAGLPEADTDSRTAAVTGACVAGCLWPLGKLGRARMLFKAKASLPPLPPRAGTSQLDNSWCQGGRGSEPLGSGAGTPQVLCPSSSATSQLVMGLRVHEPQERGTDASRALRPGPGLPLLSFTALTSTPRRSTSLLFISYPATVLQLRANQGRCRDHTRGSASMQMGTRAFRAHAGVGHWGWREWGQHTGGCASGKCSAVPPRSVLEPVFAEAAAAGGSLQSWD